MIEIAKKNNGVIEHQIQIPIYKFEPKNDDQFQEEDCQEPGIWKVEHPASDEDAEGEEEEEDAEVEEWEGDTGEGEQEEEDAKDNIRSDLITYLTQLNTEMTTLLTAKIESENGTLEQCDKETLEVINKIKAPLWMVVNTTLFGDKALTQEVIVNLKIALQDMRSTYCQGSSSVPPPLIDSCDLEEINQSYIWM